MCKLIMKAHDSVLLLALAPANCANLPNNGDWEDGNNEAEHLPLLDDNSKFWPGYSVVRGIIRHCYINFH